LYRPIL